MSGHFEDGDVSLAGDMGRWDGDPEAVAAIAFGAAVGFKA